jgi:glyoxylate reductase
MVRKSKRSLVHRPEVAALERPTIVLTHPLFPEIVRQELEPFANVIVAKTPSALRKALPKADGLLCLLTDRVTSFELDRAPRLRAVANFAVGVNNIDLKECQKRGIRVANTPDVLTRSTAELALALLLACARRIPEGEAICRKDAFSGWTPDYLLGLELKGRHAVLAGPGRIGKETGALFQALGLTVEYLARNSGPLQIRRALGRAQVLSLHFPLTPETHYWLGPERIALLPRDAIVLNTTRGPTVDEKALTAALRKKQIFSAGLDVFEREPRIPAALRKLPNCVLLPHVGSATLQARHAMARSAIQGILGLLNGQRIPNEVKLKKS